MKSANRKSLAAATIGWLLAMGSTAVAQTIAPTHAEQIAAATGSALQGNAAQALRTLEPLAPGELSRKDRSFRECMMTRFGPAPDTQADQTPSGFFIETTVQTYRDYWRRALLQPDKRAAAEGQLLAALRASLRRPDLPDMDSIEPALARRLAADGVHSLQGRTGQLRELMIWKVQNEQRRPIELPEGPSITRVVLLDEFLSLGWGDYATCGRRGAGGWARGDAIFAVVPRYESLGGEEFRVTFLGHEAQHFADLRRFPSLKPWELEYRAKLVELGQANLTRQRVLAKFAEDRGDDPASPHSYANKRVLGDVRARLGLGDRSDLNLVAIKELQRVAVAILKADSNARTASPNPNIAVRGRRQIGIR
ncbi:MAG TPA: hypothetical protein VF637_06610 [Sphingomicrobium sp.]